MLRRTVVIVLSAVCLLPSTSAKSCLEERDEALKNGPMPGLFIPVCTEDGKYETQQCHGSTGDCWCVDRNGQELRGTRRSLRRQEEMVDCETACLVRRNKALEYGPMPGRFIPSCTDEGEYEKQQCHGSVGHCWCVDKSGKEIRGTRKSFRSHQIEMDCENGCLVRRNEALKKGPVPGLYVPSCNEEGEYSLKQCHGSIGHCWCVDPSGQEINGTRKSIPQGETLVDCETSCTVSHHMATLDKPTPIGRYIPQCTEEGLYEPLQCHGSTGHCWCVDEKGQELPGTRQRGYISC